MSSTWYSVTVDAAAGDAWRPLDPPCTEVSEATPDEIADRRVADYCLDELGAPWRVRVYAGYNRYDDLLFERRGSE